MTATLESARETRAHAVFASTLATGSSPHHGHLANAISWSIRAHDGAGGCLAFLAYAYGADPETAAFRMRWALRIVDTADESLAERRRSDAAVRQPA